MSKSQKKIGNYLLNRNLSGLRRETGRFWTTNTSLAPAWKQAAIPRTCGPQPGNCTELITPTMKSLLGFAKSGYELHEKCLCVLTVCPQIRPCGKTRFLLQGISRKLTFGCFCRGHSVVVTYVAGMTVLYVKTCTHL